MPEFKQTLFQSGTVLGRVVTATVLSAVLAGCAAQSGGSAMMKAEPTFMRLTEERVFAQALRQRYLELATNAYDRGDFDRSDFYSLRAIMAVEGKLVDPAGAGGQANGELASARARLARALSSDARLGAPDLAARAQAGFDCWWLESQGGDQAIASACAFNTEGALAELESVASGNLIARAVGQPQQIVINGQTPSQTMNVGGATIEIINNTPAQVAPPAPVPTQSWSVSPPIESMPPQDALSYTPPPAFQEPVEDISTRTFVLEPSEITDTVIPTVPITNDSAPIDLTGGTRAPMQDDTSFGGQYIVSDMERYADMMVPSYNEPGIVETVPLPSPEPAMPVFTDEAASFPAMPAPVMMEQQGGVLSSLIDARSQAQSDFAVYFGFDSDAITPEAEDILSDMIQQIRTENRDSISLMGFTDSAGDSRYNQLLAMRRANAVRQFIQQRTNRPIRFEVMPVGEAEAVRDGGDGVTEALNRRVEIILK